MSGLFWGGVAGLNWVVLFYFILLNSVYLATSRPPSGATPSA